MTKPNVDLNQIIVDTLRLEVHPSVVFKLGADLITDDLQALVELIKNSYDADAKVVRVKIDTHALFDPITGEPLDEWNEVAGEKDRLAPLRGSITVVDDGCGMDLDAIRRGWLTVSLSDKLRMKAVGETTSGGRTPLGDKGLGRLGAQRLGETLRLTTKTRYGWPLQVSLPWARFAGADNLSSIPLDVIQLEADGASEGTEVVIQGLRRPSYWSNHGSDDLQRGLASLVSPYKGVSGTEIYLTINGIQIDLREKAAAILDSAPVSYDMIFDGSTLNITARFSTEYLRPSKGAEGIAEFERLIQPDNGFAFSEWLLKDFPDKQAPHGVMLGDDKHFLTSRVAIGWNEVRGVELGDGDPVNPGPFSGKVSSVPLDRDTRSVFDKKAEYKSFTRDILGIKVYRDGFGIRMDDDWLGLGAQWSSASSYYTLRPANTLGYISISARDNSALEETTNREAFADTPAYRNFKALLEAWLHYTTQVQGFLGRKYVQYRQDQTKKRANVEPEATTPKTLILSVSSQIDDTHRLAREATMAKSSINRIVITVNDLEASRQDAQRTVFADPVMDAAVTTAVSRIKQAAEEAEQLMGKLDDLLSAQESMRARLELLQGQVALTQQQMEDAWESVALGLSAETLSHEVLQISERLRAKSAQITTYLQNLSGSSKLRV
ncbi:MAG: ATP-binding protein [Propionibacteriaceae bacterium]|jgi:hypothetical protein|nr:ATP-binding protein [Propionibacteriaceae bacterium]